MLIPPSLSPNQLQQKVECQVKFNYDLKQSFRLSRFNEKQIITGYPTDGAMGSSGGGRVWHCGTPEPRLNAIYIVSSVGTSFFH